MASGTDRDSVHRGPIQGAVARGEDPERWIAVVERLENGGAPDLARVRERGGGAVFRMDDGDGGPVFIKRHGERRLQAELRENRFPMPPGERCWEAAEVLDRCHVATPRVRANLQVVDGAYLRADYLMTDAITEGPSFGTLLGDVQLSGAQRGVILAELARLVAHMHVRGVFHNDLKPAHVFRLGDDKLSLIDLEYLMVVDRRQPRRYEVARWGDLTTLLREFESATTSSERRTLGEVYKRASGLPASEPLTMQYHWVHNSRPGSPRGRHLRRRGS
jgi:hypothetical protein